MRKECALVSEELLGSKFTNFIENVSSDLETSRQECSRNA